MKILAVLTMVISLGLVIAHAAAPISHHFTGSSGFAGHYLNGNNTGFQLHGDETTPSPAMSLMQTDTALCDQPYFVEVYELSVSFFSSGDENIQADEFADLLFGHARDSGYFSEEEAQAWINHIKDIPSQVVAIFHEDPTVLDSCYNFQVATVGPPF